MCHWSAQCDPQHLSWLAHWELNIVTEKVLMRKQTRKCVSCTVSVNCCTLITHVSPTVGTYCVRVTTLCSNRYNTHDMT